MLPLYILQKKKKKEEEEEEANIAYFSEDVLRYEGVSRSFRTGHLARELQMVQLSATMCSCIAIL
jgi:hypothetical protein